MSATERLESERRGGTATEIFALFASIVTFGQLDYLPDVQRPWCVDISRRRKVGRGKTLVEAVRDHLGL